MLKAYWNYLTGFFDIDDDVISILKTSVEKPPLLLPMIQNPLLPTYKLVIDNFYAVCNRINVSSISDVSKFSGIETVNVKDILPVTADLSL